MHLNDYVFFVMNMQEIWKLKFVYKNKDSVFQINEFKWLNISIVYTYVKKSNLNDWNCLKISINK